MNGVVDLDEHRGQPTGTPSNDGGGGGGPTYGERLAALEAHMQHVATKAWVLGGVVGGMGLAAMIALAVMKLFSQ